MWSAYTSVKVFPLYWAQLAIAPVGLRSIEPLAGVDGTEDPSAGGLF